MTDKVSKEMADELPRADPLLGQAGGGEIASAETPADASQDADELELDESAILTEDADDAFFAESDSQAAEDDYVIRPCEDRETLPAAVSDAVTDAATLQPSYYESYLNPLASGDLQPLELQEQSFVAAPINRRPTIPLSDLDRHQIEKQLQWQQIRRLSLNELFGFTTFVALILAAASWLPLNWYTLLLGCVTFGLLLAILKRGQTRRSLWISLITLLVIYLGSIVITIIRLES